LQESQLNKDPNSGISIKVTPDIEKLLFNYFVSGASVRSIHQQFGIKYGFSLQSLYTARDIYKWEQRRAAIFKVVRNDNDLNMAERVKDYQAFLDDLLSEAIIRFSDNSATGQNKNPFNTLKVTSIKDIKDLIDVMINLQNGGIRKYEVENTGSVQLSTKKQEKLLEILADDDE